MTRPTQAVIDLSALHHNLQRVRTCATQQRIIAVIKADGYGHGAVRIAHALSSKVEAFAVCCLEEAIELREAGIQLPIVLLEGFYQIEELPLIIEHNLQVVIHTPTQVTSLLKAQPERPISVWLKVDSGMHRLGFTPLEIGETWKRFTQCTHIAKPIRLMSHLS
ncbi:MAG: alanine racemase, partial [Beggiatoa sp. IS2]